MGIAWRVGNKILVTHVNTSFQGLGRNGCNGVVLCRAYLNPENGQ